MVCRQFVVLLLLIAAPTSAAQVLRVDAVPDPHAPWLAEAPERYTAWLEQHQVGTFLQLVAPVFATRLEASQPLRIHLVAGDGGESMHARTVADDLAVQIREQDTPDRRADVIVHEAIHALQQRGDVLRGIKNLPTPAQ